MTIKELVDKGAIYIANIEDGFQNYKNGILTMTKEEARSFFQNLIQVYGVDYCYVDFYYFALSKEEQKRLDCIITDEDIIYLKKLRPWHDEKEQIIFPLYPQLLEIIIKFNDTSALFSTLYFIEHGEKKRLTYWGNYNHQYVCFEDR